MSSCTFCVPLASMPTTRVEAPAARAACAIHRPMAPPPQHTSSTSAGNAGARSESERRGDAAAVAACETSGCSAAVANTVVAATNVAADAVVAAAADAVA
eukprot:5718930-Pleurochrysis_carterae.AAC.1